MEIFFTCVKYRWKTIFFNAKINSHLLTIIIERSLSMSIEEEHFWNDLLTYAQTFYTKPTFETWVKPAKLIKIDEHYIHISLPSELAFEKWQEDLQTKLIELGFKYTRRDLEPKFHYPEENELIEEIVIEPENDLNPDLLEQANLNPNYTFDRFIPGKNNRFAFAGAKAVADAPGTIYNPLILYGGTGLGKTHLMQAIGHKILLDHPDFVIRNVTCENFVNDYIDAVRYNEKFESFRKKYRDIDLLLIDDIQFLANKTETQEEFFHTFNALTQKKKQIVITSDRPIAEISDLTDRLISRFQNGTACDVLPPDLETRIAILQEKADFRHMDVPDNVLEYIAGTIDSNVRELEGALSAVDLYAKAYKQPITISLAAKALMQAHSNGEKEELSIVRIQEEVSQYFHVSVRDIKGKKRTKDIVIPRQIAMYLACELTDNSLPKIGKEFGGKDHTTVMHSRDKIQKLIQTNEQVNNDVQKIKNKFSF